MYCKLHKENPPSSRRAAPMEPLFRIYLDRVYHTYVCKPPSPSPSPRKTFLHILLIVSYFNLTYILLAPPGKQKTGRKEKEGQASASFVEWTVRKQNYTHRLLNITVYSPTCLAITDPKKRKKTCTRGKHKTRYYEVRVEKQPLLLGVGRVYK